MGPDDPIDPIESFDSSIYDEEINFEGDPLLEEDPGNPLNNNPNDPSSPNYDPDLTDLSQSKETKKKNDKFIIQGKPRFRRLMLTGCCLLTQQDQKIAWVREIYSHPEGPNCLDFLRKSEKALFQH